MLLPEQLEALTERVVAVYRAYQNRVVAEMARALSRLGQPDAQWQVRLSVESQNVVSAAMDELARTNAQSEMILQAVLERAAVLSVGFDDMIYQEAGLTPLPVKASPLLLILLAEGLGRISGVLRGLMSGSAAWAGYAFGRAADSLRVIGGEFNYDLALRRAIQQAARDQLRLAISGKQESLDAAVRRTVLSGINATTGKMQEARAAEMGSDLVQVSAHVGARNKGSGPANHEGWQGKIYSRTGAPPYDNFVEKTGLGTGEGLLGWNCRHSYWPFYEDISARSYTRAELRGYADKTVRYNGHELGYYDATQRQREIERRIRYWKEQRDALNAAGLDVGYETGKVREWQEIARKFVNQTGLERQRGREMTFLTPWTR